MGTDELAEVLVGGHHVGDDAFLFSHTGESADHVVGLIALDLDYGDAVGAYNFLDDRHGTSDIFGSGGAFGFIILEGFVAECRTGGVEADCEVGGILLAEHLFEGVDEAEYSGGVEAGACDAGCADEGIVGTEYQRIGIEKKQTIHNIIISYLTNGDGDRIIWNLKRSFRIFLTAR